MARILCNGTSAAFNDGTVWPIPSNAAAEIEWQLRYGNAMNVRMQAASIVNAYQALIRLPQKERNKRVMVLRAAADIANKEYKP